MAGAIFDAVSQLVTLEQVVDIENPLIKRIALSHIIIILLYSSILWCTQTHCAHILFLKTMSL